VRLTTEQLSELGQALSILSAKSSVLKEREDLRQLMEENAAAAGETDEKNNPLAKRIRNMITRIDEQLGEYDTSVGSKMNVIAVREDGKIPVSDLKKALQVIKHRYARLVHPICLSFFDAFRNLAPTKRRLT
jgi:LETM1 and EF-hand domain-containing protein 1